MILNSLLNIVWTIVLIHVIMSWLISFNILNVRQPLVGQIWQALENLLQPIYYRIRAFLPNTGAVDLSPLVLLFLIFALRAIILNNF